MQDEFTHFGNIMPEELFIFTVEFLQIKKYHIYKLGRNQYTVTDCSGVI